MNQASFWRLIDDARGQTDSCDAVAEILVARLTQLSSAEIVDFVQIMDELMDRAYRWDLWGAAYIINGGCSDDGFEYFRGWLITQGQRTYERALQDPESLATVASADVECEDVLYVGLQAFQAITGQDQLPPRYAPPPEEPSGTPWTEEELDARFPKLTAAFG